MGAETIDSLDDWVLSGSTWESEDFRSAKQPQCCERLIVESSKWINFGERHDYLSFFSTGFERSKATGFERVIR